MNDEQQKHFDIVCLHWEYDALRRLPNKNRQTLERMCELKNKIKDLEDELKGVKS